VFLKYLVDTVLPSNGRFSDWALVVAFYAALHYTKGAILRDSGISVQQHKRYTDAHGTLREGHNDLVRYHIPSIATRYRDLFDLGHQARYRGFFRLPDNSLAEVKRQQRALRDIKLACGVDKKNGGD